MFIWHDCMFIWHDCIRCYFTFFLLSIEILVVWDDTFNFCACRVWLVLATIMLLEQPICHGNQKLFKELVFLELFAQVNLLFSHIWNFLGKRRGMASFYVLLSNCRTFNVKLLQLLEIYSLYFFFQMQYFKDAISD